MPRNFFPCVVVSSFLCSCLRTLGNYSCLERKKTPPRPTNCFLQQWLITPMKLWSASRSPGEVENKWQTQETQGTQEANFLLGNIDSSLFNCIISFPLMSVYYVIGNVIIASKELLVCAKYCSKCFPFINPLSFMMLRSRWYYFPQ